LSPSNNGVVLIVLDSVRGDSIDYDDGNTPAISRLGARGMRYDRAIAPAAWTLPSFVSMMTGLSPTEHGLQAMGSAKDAIVRAGAGIGRFVSDGAFLPAALSKDGVKTFLGSANVWVSPASGFGRAFDAVAYVAFPPGPSRKGSPPGSEGAAIQSDSKQHAPDWARRRLPVPVKHAGKVLIEKASTINRIRPVGRWALKRGDKGGSAVVDSFSRWVREQDGPFFALVALIETHDPHLAPRGWGPADRRTIAWTVATSGRGLARRMNQHNWGYRSMSQQTIARLRRAYMAEVRYSDHCVDRIVRAVTDAGKDATFIVTADHGESFGEHGLVGHGVSLGEQVARVPLVAAGPSIRPGRESRPVGLASTASAVADILDSSSTFPTGSLLSDATKGGARIEVEAPGRYFHSAGMRYREPPEGADRPAAAFYEENMKLIVGSFWGEALYDLAVDPTESANLIRRREIPEGLAKMRDAWQARVKERA
jgi:arylsulfatase A-like enzyme